MFGYLSRGSSDTTPDNRPHDRSDNSTHGTGHNSSENAAFRSTRRSAQCCSCGSTNGQTGNIFAYVMGTIRVIFGLVRVENIDDGTWILDVIHGHEDFPVANGVVK